jgi:glycosyltransferase involved in cell wall biosynthesis
MYSEMTPRPRLVYLSSLAVPHQIKLCYALRDYFDAEFWFYELPDRMRGKWWRIDLGTRCQVLDDVWFFRSRNREGKYLALGLASKLGAFDPDIVMLGGFSIPSNFLAYRWAKKHGKKTIVFTERSRDRDGVLRRRGIAWRILRWLYRDADMVIVSADDAISQFRDEFGFGEKVVVGRYAADLDAYFAHPLREKKSAYTYLFANRMTEIYNPTKALEIFASVLAKYPGSRLLMNAAGELGETCRSKIRELGIADAVEFLTNIPSWDQLHTAYARSDILILPANFSNGNFTILEAMASGMGIVVSDRVLATGKLVNDGVNGFNCEPTVEAFVNRIERYIANPDLFAKHAAINRSLAIPLSPRPTAQVYFDLISSIELKEAGAR